MVRAPDIVANARTLAYWQVGMGLASWRYLWRTTPVYRQQESASDGPPPLPAETSHHNLQGPDQGVGPLFHRRYRTQICGARTDTVNLMERIADDPNRASPIEVARFRKDRGESHGMEVGDEFVIRMPGPWDGPVRVVDRTPTSFRFVTLSGHLEAGQIEFRLEAGGEHLVFVIESWARSGDQLSYLLYDWLLVAQEMQLHMWTHFAERVARISGGRMAGGVEVLTSRKEAPRHGG